MGKVDDFSEEHETWIAAGRPMRSPERTAALFAICAACPHKVAGGFMQPDSCCLCGCTISPTRRFMNKLAWATTTCPREPDQAFGVEPEDSRQAAATLTVTASNVARAAAKVGVTICGTCGKKA